MPEKARKLGLKNNFDQRIFMLAFFVKNIHLCCVARSCAHRKEEKTMAFKDDLGICALFLGLFVWLLVF